MSITSKLGATLPITGGTDAVWVPDNATQIANGAVFVNSSNSSDLLREYLQLRRTTPKPAATSTGNPVFGDNTVVLKRPSLATNGTYYPISGSINLRAHPEVSAAARQQFALDLFSVYLCANLGNFRDLRIITL